MRNYICRGVLLVIAVCFSTVAYAQPQDQDNDVKQLKLTTEFIGAEGEVIGSATLVEGVTGVLIKSEFNGLPPGVHGYHIHETGDCGEPGEFQAAGSHLNPDNVSHGFYHENGPHPGDLPNIHVPETGNLTVELYSEMLSLEKEQQERVYLLDENGSALVVHENADDYFSQTSGNSGGRIACAPITNDKLQQ